jgi:hypothetical protein
VRRDSGHEQVAKYGGKAQETRISVPLLCINMPMNGPKSKTRYRSPGRFRASSASAFKYRVPGRTSGNCVMDDVRATLKAQRKVSLMKGSM